MTNGITEGVIGAAIAVHRELGPGLLESAYQQCMRIELRHRKIPYEAEKNIPIVYRGSPLECGFRVDLIVARQVVVELKSTEKLHPVHDAQLLTYLRLLNCEVGLLINFNVSVLRHGIRRLTIKPL